MHRLRRVVVVALLALFVPASAGGGVGLCSDTPSCLAAVESGRRSTVVASANFTQTKYVQLLSEPVVTSGRFAFRAPDVVVWQMGDPPLRVRITPERVELPEAVSRELGDATAALAGTLRQVSALLAGSLEHLDSLFRVEAESSSDGVRVRLAPRGDTGRQPFSAIELVFQAPYYPVTFVRIDEALGDRLEIRFTDFHRNDAEAEAAVSRP